MRRREAFEPAGEMRKVNALCLFSGSQGDEEGKMRSRKANASDLFMMFLTGLIAVGPNGQRRRILHSVLRLAGTVVFRSCILNLYCGELIEDEQIPGTRRLSGRDHRLRPVLRWIHPAAVQAMSPFSAIAI